MNKNKLFHPLVMWLTVLVGGFILWQIVPVGYFFDQNQFAVIVFILALLNWAYVYISIIKVHPRVFSHPQNIDQLITEGRYAAVRHPMYLADIILGLSLFIWNPSYQMLSIVVWLMIVLSFWANLEERILEDKFVEDYRAYKRRVPMFVPKFKKR